MHKNVNIAYKELLTKIIMSGEYKKDRTGTGTISSFGNQIKVDLTDGFPLLTTKRVYWKGIVAETVMFLKGITDLKFLLDLDVDIWTRDAWKFYLKNSKFDDDTLSLDAFRKYAKTFGFNMGHIYGKSWVDFNGEGTNQLESVVKELRINPDSRRLKVYTANPTHIQDESLVLPPCHDSFQLYSNNGYLDILFTMRSSDGFHGLPFNIASYALINAIIAEMTGLKPRNLVAQLGDTHIYSTHMNAVNEQLGREPLQLPKLKLSERVKSLKSISDIEIEDIELIGYNPHPSIKAPQAF